MIKELQLSHYRFSRMPPKRKAAATKAKAGGKKAKKGEEDDVSTSMKEAFKL